MRYLIHYIGLAVEYLRTNTLICMFCHCLFSVVQRQGCIHGEELAYVFGVPLVNGMMHFPHNYTKAEVLLSEATIIYWSNFARTG